MRYLFRLALRNLWIRKTRTVLTTLGIVGGLILSPSFLHVLGILSGHPLDYIIPAFALTSSLVTALLGPKLAALWPAEVAARTDMITALKEERGG